MWWWGDEVTMKTQTKRDLKMEKTRSTNNAWKGWLGKLNTNILLKWVHFRETKISCMTDHVKPTLRDINPDHIILHTGTNNLWIENTTSQIAKATISLATSLKNDDNTELSGFVPRLDNLDNKANEVNRHQVLMCKERNISFFSHDESIDPSKHLNESKLHLNSNGIKILAENFLDFWQSEIYVSHEKLIWIRLYL